MKSSKKILLMTVLSTSFLVTGISQLRVTPGGRVGIGTNNPLVPLHVNGVTYIVGSTGHIIRIHPNNPGTEIGTSTDIFDFWFTDVGYNTIRAQMYYSMSDIKLKSNITPIESALDIIRQTKGYSYVFKDDINRTTQYGFIAQEIEKILPGLVSESHDLKGVNYDGYIAILVEAMKEQQVMIDLLKAEILEIREYLNMEGTRSYEILENGNILEQNIPNPFQDKTTIRYKISSQDFQNASLLIFDLNGTLLKTHNIPASGSGLYNVNGSDLKAGMYLYTLIVNDKIIDTKRMILL